MRALTKLPGYLLALLILFFFACGEDAPQKSVSLEDIRPKAAQKNSLKAKENPADTLQAYLNYYANDSSRLGIAQIFIDSISETHFLDRFTPVIQRFQLKDSSQQNYAYQRWVFKDSSSCTEAFYNWLDQAGKNKSSVGLNTGQIWSLNHAFFMIGKKEIILVSSSKPISVKNWVKWHTGTADFRGFCYIFYAKPKKKTIWMNYTNNKIITL